MNETLENTNQELQSVKDTLYIKSHERATKVSAPLLNDVFLLMKNKTLENNYCSIRTQKKKANTAIKGKGTDFEIILKFEFSPNPISLNNEVKIRLKKMNLADLYYNDIVLRDPYTEQDLKDIYVLVHKERIVDL